MKKLLILTVIFSIGNFSQPLLAQTENNPAQESPLSKRSTKEFPIAAPKLWRNLSPGKYQVGYWLLLKLDHSRSLQVDTQLEPLSFSTVRRPLQLSIWYPAVLSIERQRAMSIRDYLSALNSGFSNNIKDELIEERFKKFTLAQELSDETFGKLVNEKTFAVENADFLEADKKYPVVYIAQGLFYESPITHMVLCEFLASHGFVVVTVPLMGARSPLVRLDPVDLEAEIRDLEFAQNIISDSNALRIDKNKFGIIGFDMGGLAGAIWQMRNPEAKILISLDSGLTAEHNLKLIKQMPDYNPLEARGTIIHFTRPTAEVQARGFNEDLSFFEAARFTNRSVVRAAQMRHADFTMRPLIETQLADRRDSLTLARADNYEAILNYILFQLKTHLTDEKISTVTSAALTVEQFVAPQQIPPTESEFLSLIAGQGAETAEKLFEKLSREFPDTKIFREHSLDQIGFNRLYRGELSDAVRIFRMNTAAYPQSGAAFASLGTAYQFSGNQTEAVKNFRKSLELDPTNSTAARGLMQYLNNK